MDCEEDDNSAFVTAHGRSEDESGSAVNSLILEYYKKFGRKRDLEQYFSLSTAQGDLRDPSGSFWRSMKSENDSSDSSGKKSESSQEVCRISIRCSTFPEPSSSKINNDHMKPETVSPPIIIEEMPPDTADSTHYTQHDKTYSDDESGKSDDNHSQKSYDVLLDTSTNKALSPSSSITSQRKLEWDSLADVGYGNESDRKTSASSLSTLEKLALKQQYTNNDTSSNLGVPTAHSTPLEDNEVKAKSKKGIGKKTTKIYKKDVDLVEVNVPNTSNNNQPQSINVNLTKHISFNVEKDGKVTVENVLKDVSVSPEKKLVEAGVSPIPRVDREMQTSLVRTKESDSSPEMPKNRPDPHKIPIVISLNTLRKRVRHKKFRRARRKVKTKRNIVKENVSVLEKSGEQLSEAESFEYMPGHIYNQNQLQANAGPSNMVGNKSSLESSGALTTDSSKGSKHSFSKDLKKSIDVLRNALRDRCDDAALRKQLIKQVCEKLLNSKYRDDDSSSDFLSGLSFSSQKLGLRERNQTTSTSDPNDSGDKAKPKKSILRNDKFNAGVIASSSQSAPNLPVASNSERPVNSKLIKPLINSNTDSELSSKEKNSSDNVFAKTSSEELYQKYLEALNREQAYKRHLKDKEMFLKQKLVCSDSAFKIPVKSGTKVNDRLKDLIKDLTRNNYADGSGDASNLEGGPNTNVDFNRIMPVKSQRSHSVFTLSSGNSECQNRKPNLKKRLQCDIKDMTKPGSSKDKHYCCCPHHSNNANYGVTDSSVQVNIRVPYTGDSSPDRSMNLRDLSPQRCQRAESPRCKKTKPAFDNPAGDVKYVCLCNNKLIKDVPDNFFLYKCSRVMKNEDSLKSCSLESNHSCVIPCSPQNQPSTSKCPNETSCVPEIPNSKSSQTNLLSKILRRRSSDKSLSIIAKDKSITDDKTNKASACGSGKILKICEATRCLQTEISIDPKIPEPTLSDIRIVSETDCAKLIIETCRDLSDMMTNTSQPGSGTRTTSISTRSTGTSKNFENFKNFLGDDDYTPDFKIQDQERIVPNSLQNIDNADNYTIPIQGTNMTLMVSIGSKERKDDIPPSMVSDYVCTERAIQIEQGTSLMEECSKGIQHITDDNASNKTKSVDHNSNTSSSPDKNITKQKSNEVKFNTYPKSPVNERKPLLRSNTDTNNLGQSNIKLDFSDKGSMKSNRSKNSANCICGCNINNCSSKCKGAKNKERCVSPRSLVSGEPSPRINKSNASSIEKSKCACGCTLKSCNNQCKGSNKSCNSTMKSTSEKSSKSDNGASSPVSKRKLSPSRDKKIKCECECSVENCNNKCKAGSKSGSLNAKETGCQINDRPNTVSVGSQYDIKCVCGCSDEHCGNKCKETGTDAITTSCHITPDEQSKNNAKTEADDCSLRTNNAGVQIDNDEIPEEGLNKCVCGCVKDDCNNKCTSTTSEKNIDCTPKTIKSNDTRCPIDIEGTSLIGNQKCVCGCTEKDCDNKCATNSKATGDCLPQKADSNRTACQIGTDKGPIRNLINCICGCFDKNCNNKCLSNITRSNGDGSNQQTDSETQKCNCGCPNSISNCKESCCPFLKSKSKEIATQKNLSRDSSRSTSRKSVTSPKPKKNQTKIDLNKNRSCQTDNVKSSSKSLSSKNIVQSGSDSEAFASDPILEMIQSITKRYSKANVEKDKRKKCFKEIINVMNYLLETENPCDNERPANPCETSSTPASDFCPKTTPDSECCDKPTKKCIDRGIQKCSKKCKNKNTSDFSTDIPGTSTDSATCKVLNKIRKECEKYHQKRCKNQGGRRCDGSSSTSVNCDKCRKTHYCHCRYHKCKAKKSSENASKKPVAYNLIIQTSESLMSEEPPCQTRELKNIIVKVPPKKSCLTNMPFKELETKLECGIPSCPQTKKDCRSKSMPNESELSSLDEILRRSQGCTVREYLEKNRPDFVENCSQRQNCLKFISGSRNEDSCPPRLKMVVVHTPNTPGFCNDYKGMQTCMTTQCNNNNPCVQNEVTRIATERAVKRDVLSMRVAQLSNVNEMDPEELLRLARDIGQHIRRKQPAPKLMSEREMKKHSEKIYKKLPEVVRKKEEAKKESEKKTNLLMANIFKKNLQKKTLRGAVNLSNYSTVIKI